MLEAKKLSRSYRLGRNRLSVLQGIDLVIEKGCSVAITGSSGAGKSTLLHLLAGLDRPDSGDVIWNGQSLVSMNERERACFRNRTIGVVFQFYHLVPELTALENVMLPGLVGGGQRSNLRAQALSALAQVSLEPRAQHRPRELSGGEMQRVAIARALVNDPELLLCDEPTGNLDSKTGSGVMDLLFGLQSERDISLVLVTHEQRLAEIAQRQLVLQDGRIVN